jgi:ATP-dependent RNA helicase DDX10/DBP4
MSVDEKSEDEESEDEEPEERKRKWFEDESEDEEQLDKKKRIIDVAEPQTLEDQEALALKLLGA